MAGSWFVVCSGAGRKAGAIGREGNRAARAGKMFSNGQKKETAPAKPAPKGVARGREKDLWPSGASAARARLRARPRLRD